MKKLFLIFHLSFLITIGFGQMRAVTSTGDEVILNKDGTWKYANADVQKQTRIDTSKLQFSKSPSSSFVVKSSRVSCGIYLDPKKWSFAKSAEGEDSEFEFTLKGKDGYALLIPEKTEIPLETLHGIAFDNAKAVAPDMKIVQQEYRKVNDQTVLLMQMSGTLKGIKLTYMGYYFSSEEGSVQVITYAATNLFNQNKSDLEEFLNGFVLIKK